MGGTQPRWPSEAALKNAVQAVKKAAGDVGGVRVYPDGSFDVLTPAAAAALDERAASAKMADAIRKVAG